MIQIIRFSVGALILASGLSGCASFFEIDDRDSAADYDRGYSVGSAGSVGAGFEEEDEDSMDRRETVDSRAASVGKDSFGREPAAARPVLQRAIQSRDVVLGMTRNQVLQSWGEPSMRESAGRGNDGHERWTYRSRMSLGGGERVLIFENGRVAGWYR